MKFQIVFLIVTIALASGGVIKSFQCPSAGNFLDESSMDPKKYISCEENKNGKIVAKYKDCDEKEVFDFDTQKCVAESAKTRKFRQDFNFQCHEAGFFPDFSTDCTGYFVCQLVNGVIELKEHTKCDSGDVFWPESETCVPPAAYQCPMTSTASPTTEAVTSPAEPTTTTEEPTTTTEEPTTTTEEPTTTTEEPTTTTEEPTTTTEEPTTTTEGPKFQCSQQGQFHDEGNCRKYYQCVEYEGKLVTLHLQCKPESLVFHKDLKYCVAEDLYPCSI